MREAHGAGHRLRRHVPPLLFLVALTLMILAIARPAAVVTLPSQHETIIMAMDVSGSMRATDVKPSRIAAAQEAARAFVAEQPKTTRIGVVSFAATASGCAIADAQPRGHPRRHRALPAAARHGGRQRDPGRVEDDLPRCRIRLALVESAARGGARESARSRQGDRQVGRPRPCRRARTRRPRSSCSPTARRRPAPTRSNRRAWPPTAASASTPSASARRAARRSAPKAGRCACASTSSRSRRSPNVTQGEYFYAGTAADLQKIYKNLNTKLFFEQKETEISALFAAVAAGLALVSGLLSLLWFNRIL